jgi:hypothetical protein
VRQPASDDTQSQKKESESDDFRNLGDVKRPFIYQGKIDGEGVCPSGDRTNLGGVVQERDEAGSSREKNATLLGRRLEVSWYDWDQRPFVLYLDELIDHSLVVEGVGNEIPHSGYVVLPVQLRLWAKGERINVPFLVNKMEVQC